MYVDCLQMYAVSAPFELLLNFTYSARLPTPYGESCIRPWLDHIVLQSTHIRDIVIPLI